MNNTRQYKIDPAVLKEEAVTLILEQVYSVPEAAKFLNIKNNLLCN